LDYIGSLFFLESEMIGSNNAAIPFTYYSEVGCMDDTFCNYNPHATEQPDGACFEVDECGICGGGGPTEGFDCDGNELSLYSGMIPEVYEIKSVYPNPFNPVSNLIYGIPENAHLEVMVFDIRGRKIESLYKGFQFAGYHEISWDASQQPSGVYLVKILSENFTDTRKIILMK
ncbi:MAG: T9SS type A sorting domain-containing protein, partial [Candidatus Marinimicrobia bacterium]|nr:T9SS type A sorting domain-containing protein [Candidatus Neomarinimicrobiota bacterium]